jgi:hypothetical protein
MNGRQAWNIVVVVGTVVALSLVATSVIRAYWIRSEAEGCLVSIQKIKVGSSTIHDVQVLMGPYRKSEDERTVTFHGKVYTTHQYQFISNGPLLIGLFHPAMFTAGFDVENEVVISKNVGFGEEPYRQVSTSESMTEGFMHDTNLDGQASWIFVALYDPPVKMHVGLDERASDADRQAAFDYDLGCFTKLWGCWSVHDILPAVKGR